MFNEDSVSFDVEHISFFFPPATTESSLTYLFISIRLCEVKVIDHCGLYFKGRSVTHQQWNRCQCITIFFGWCNNVLYSA